jgi:hypothetical protein
MAPVSSAIEQTSNGIAAGFFARLFGQLYPTQVN